MSDNLEWMNRHGVLFRHLTVQETVEKEKYKLTPELEPFVVMDPMSSEDYVAALMGNGRHKDVCDYLAYALHRRAAVWWGYRALVTLMEELEANPAVERDIADIGKPKPFDIPDWCKDPNAAAKEAAANAKDAATKAAMEKARADLMAQVEESKKLIPPDVQNLWDTVWGRVCDEFKKVHGVTPMELLEKAAKKSGGPSFVIDPNSPIFKMEKELKAQIEAMRQETVAHIKKVVPPVNVAHRKKLSDSAMQAVWRWVVSPDEVNSKLAYETGNECADQPAGLLSMTAFWSFGDMDPTGKTTVPTPPGLAANGLSQVFLKAALAKGGTRKYDERYELYAGIGLDVLRGHDLWSDAVSEKRPPHAQVVPPTAQPSAKPDAQSNANGYQKWEPRM